MPVEDASVAAERGAPGGLKRPGALVRSAWDSSVRGIDVSAAVVDADGVHGCGAWRRAGRVSAEFTESPRSGVRSEMRRRRWRGVRRE
jgi:hypothetical protein